MKRSVAVILMLAFLYDAGGYYVWFSMQQFHLQQQVQNEINQGLNDKDLTCIELPINDQSAISWIKPGKEFTCKGRMYDVVRIKTTARHKRYYCINDVKEKHLLANYHKNHQNNRSSRRIMLTLKNQFFNPHTTIFKQAVAETICFAPVFIYYRSLKTDIPSPPPKIV